MKHHSRTTRSKLLGLCLAINPFTTVQAEELLKWERIPLQIPLKIGVERIIFVDKNMRVGLPQALNGKLRVQSTGGAVYLKAEDAFPPTRLQLQDVENGEIILFDVDAKSSGTDEPIRLVYRNDSSATSRTPPSDVNTGDEFDSAKQVRYDAPVAVILTRYAAQNLYGPLRTVEGVNGIRQVSVKLPPRMTPLYPSKAVEVSPMASWSLSNMTVLALKLRNQVKEKLLLDPRELEGHFISATFQHRWLGSSGTPEDTTMLYLIVPGRPEQALIPEPIITTTEVRKTE
ncbi:integrating conjugative element protein [Rouxiella silvae]|uniref:Integrating conjugative element protein n=1 Tax=Rouxiella silvae TaxID=1646373 RepID=A0ABX3TTW6_9GAMM|nr:TIGR03749 family integrating conjugative element protein [Rouxiella silvae]ORJ18663.1 integrating conjugative element protein [Rouxiella silvae]